MEVFDNKRTDWQGLWYQPDRCYYSSATISLATLRKFKGNVRIILKKNKYFEKNERKPNYIFMIADCKSDNATEITVKNNGQDERKAYWKPSSYFFDYDALFCSGCGEKTVFATCEQREHPYKYCPNCGARMDPEINTYTTPRYQRRSRTTIL